MRIPKIYLETTIFNFYIDEARICHPNGYYDKENNRL